MAAPPFFMPHAAGQLLLLTRILQKSEFLNRILQEILRFAIVENFTGTYNESILMEAGESL